jgi:oligopeptide/dipeptide ABC transporter ATP-binding protein
LTETILAFREVVLSFETEEGSVKALNGVSLDIRKGKILGVVGESGSGKSVLALSTLGLVPRPPGRYGDGSRIFFEGKDLLRISEKELELVRGTGISMIFQEPMLSLNPVFKVGEQIAESVRLRILRKELKEARSESLLESLRGVKGIDENAVRKEVLDLLRDVRISDPEGALDRYPHEFSGGMKQRVMIAMALAAKPSLLIADEPTTALDVTTQAQILSLVKDLVKEFEVSVLFISHDLSVVSEVADDIAVMYAGRIVEINDVRSIFRDPKHPYTKGLLNAEPRLEETRQSLESLAGSVPSLLRIPRGCAFHPRCPLAFPKCEIDVPSLMPVGGSGEVACHLYHGEKE